MASRKVFDVVATVGKYTDKQGQEKKRYQTCGAAFENDKGQLSIKLECIPVSPEWSGWFSLYEPRKQESGAGEYAKASGSSVADFDRSEIPF